MSVTGYTKTKTDTLLAAKADSDDLGTAATHAATDFATAAQGALADSAVQPAELAPYAQTADLGTAATADTADFATAAQGAKADSAVQSVVAGDNVTVDTTDPANPVISATGGGTGSSSWDDITGKPAVIAAGADAAAARAAIGAGTGDGTSDFSGAYGDLTGTPTLGTAAAADTTDFATAAQGVKADSAVQPAGLTKAAVGLGSVDNTADADKAVLSATKLTTARAINGVDFDGTAAITVADSTKVPTTRTVNGKALSSDVTLAAADVSAVPTTRTVNGKALSADVTLAASDVSAVPTTTTVNGHALSANVVISADDLTTGALSIERLPAGSDITVTDTAGVWPDRPTARTDIIVIWRTYAGTVQPDSAVSPAVNGAYEHDEDNGVIGDLYDSVATS